MRKYLALAVFGLGAVLAACGGGGGSSVVPKGSNPVQIPTTKNTTATMVLHIPPANKQSRTKRPFYISSSTQSVGVYVALASSSASPSPSNVQIFPATTPSPCASVAGGGETCTFDVIAPVGNDVFYVATFAAASPGPSSTPLSFAVGTATVSLNPSPSASPLSFVLNVVAASISINVPSPDPSNTPNTQVFTAGVAASPVPLAISAHDAAWNTILADPTSTLAVPIIIELSPPPNATNFGGFALSLAPQCAGATPGIAPSVVILCAADFNNVSLAYDGSLQADANDHIADNVAITAYGSSFASSTSAHAVLQSNVLTYPIPGIFQGTGGTLSSGLLQTLTTGDIAYLANDGSAWGIGTFSPAAGTVSTPVIYAGTAPASMAPISLAISNDQSSVWVVDGNTGTLYCWTSLSAVAGNPAVTLVPNTASGALDVRAATIDGAGRLWYVGFDSTTQEYAGYFPANLNCTTGTVPNAQVTLTGDASDYSPFITAFQNGIAYNSASKGTYVATTLSTAVSGVNPTIGAGAMAGGVGAATNATIYGAFEANQVAGVEALPSGASSYSPLATLLPTSATGLVYSYPEALSVFSNTSGAGDRLAYAEDTFDALGFIDGLQSSPQPYDIALPNASRVYDTAFTQDGTPVMIFTDHANKAYIARAALTTTWNVPVKSVFNACYAGLFSVDQRGTSSGPFTITFSPAQTTLAVPGTTNDLFMTGTLNGTFTATVTDASGRSESYPITFTGPVC